ncbi:caspase family protein [Microcoleus sp. F10-C6]|uniref:caspase family protein n=1 Tax=unclassified Microcoleus TaxID=2642155 RepID=UPI002FD069D6
MNRNLYALLVGINEYPKERDRLQGCVNDIETVKQYLEQRLASDSCQLRIKTLFDREATREGIIQGFREHLSQAKSNDVVLFYYSGHGSQEKNIHEAFWRFEPDRKNETLYCYDSSLPGKWNLADKELAKLISEVAVKEPHICIILDCCHSGGGVKDVSQDVVERLAPADDRPRPLDSYLFSAEELTHLCSSSSSSLSSKNWEFPQGRNILMAACEDRDTAKELTIDGKKRGIFSYSLLKTLERPGKLTYRELWQQTKNTVSRELAKISSTQSPQLEVTPSDNGNLLFLDGAIAERPSYFTVRHDHKLGWVIDGGAVHGVQPPAGEETTLLALFDFNGNVNDFKDPNKSIGEAKVTKVLPQLSHLEITSNSNNLSKEVIYKAVVITVPLPAQGVYIEGDVTGVKLASQAIQSATMGNRPSAYIRQVPNRDDAQLYLQCRNQEYSIQLKGEDRPLVAPIQGFTLDNAKLAIERFEHIARWLTIRDLSTPPVSRIQPNDIEMVLLFEGEKNAASEKEIRREYQYKERKWQPPRCQLKLINKSQTTVFCTVLDLTDRFAVAAPYFEAGYVRLEPGQEALAGNGKYIKFTVDPELQNLGITETKDIFKLIVSTTEFDARLSSQDALDLPRAAHKNIFKQSTLNRLMDRAQFRTARWDEEEAYDDWYTKKVTITSVLPSK